MPYRRLPKTDQARLHALQRAVQQAGNAAYNDQAINYRTLAEAQRFLMQFENQVAQYHANFDSKVSANRQYRHRVRNARMYISHFIQVLNLSVIRGEIKRQQKELYKLDPKSNSLPDLTTEEGLLEWGKNIIDGEQQRTAAGGFAIYNPTINKVKVHYDIFCEHQGNHTLVQQNTNRVRTNLDALRSEADAIILNIWNLVEAYYKDELPYARLQKCKAYGIIFYPRRNEVMPTPETDKKLKLIKDSQPTIQWSTED
jgi:hypothetical protein